MNINLFLIILIALIIIFCIILYNGLRLLLTVEKEKGIVKYKLKATILKIAIFTREGAKGTGIDEDNEDDGTDSKDSEDDLSSDKEEAESTEKSDKKAEEEAESIEKSDKKAEEESEDEEDDEDKGLFEKYEEIKPILKELLNSREELKKFLRDFLKTIHLKKLEGNFIIGLSDKTTTVKIASLIWSIGAIVNGTKPTSLTVQPKFTEEIIDFEGKMELKINLLFLIFYSLILLTKENIRNLIREVIK